MYFRHISSKYDYWLFLCFNSLQHPHIVSAHFNQPIPYTNIGNGKTQLNAVMEWFLLWVYPTPKHLIWLFGVLFSSRYVLIYHSKTNYVANIQRTQMIYGRGVYSSGYHTVRVEHRQSSVSISHLHHKHSLQHLSPVSVSKLSPISSDSFHSYTVLRNTLYNNKWAHPLWLAIFLANHMSNVLQ